MSSLIRRMERFKFQDSIQKTLKQKKNNNSSSCTNRWMKSCNVHKKETRRSSTPGSHGFLFTKAFLSMRFLQHTIWIAGTKNIKRSVNNTVCSGLIFFFFMKRGIFFKTKTIQQHLLLCTRRFNTCVTHTPSIYTDWNDIETDRCISEMCAHFSIWAPKCLVQTTVNKSMCLEAREKKKKNGRKCAQRVQILFMIMFSKSRMNSIHAPVRFPRK